MKKLSGTHIPVLLPEVITALNIKSEGIYVDCTFGRGGHTQAILSYLNQKGRVIALDQDPDAVEAGKLLSQVDSRVDMIHSDFAQLISYIEKYHYLGKVNGILLDLGVSSAQLDTAERGFSFTHDGPLDMRMNSQKGITVAGWLSQAKMEEIARVLKEYGEERYSKHIAKAIVAEREKRPLSTTHQLAHVICEAHPAWEIGKNPATRSFQAFRIFINLELEQLQRVLPQTLKILAPQGRLVIISFHSLEDRIVKRFIRDCAKGDEFPIDLPIMSSQLSPSLRRIGKVIYPTEKEIDENPRARSAVLRVAERY